MVPFGYRRLPTRFHFKVLLMYNLYITLDTFFFSWDTSPQCNSYKIISPVLTPSLLILRDFGTQKSSLAC